RREKLDFAIVATPALELRGIRAARWSGARQVIAFAPPGRLLDGVDVTVSCDEPGDATETALVWRLAGPLGLSGVPPAVRVVAPEDVVAQAQAALAAQPWQRDRAHGEGALVGVHISARKPSQRWPIERFAELMRAIHASSVQAGSAARFMVFWAPGDASNPQHPGDDAKAQALLSLVAALPVFGWPTTNLRDLIGGIAICDRMVMADGGAMHIAAGLGKPILALFGDSDARRWRPWGVPYELLQSASRNVDEITSEAALVGYARLSQEGLG
ncbi:MAG: glycosyltransferase family 9 protein, partial [Burkholderiales bacterium]